MLLPTSVKSPPNEYPNLRPVADSFFNHTTRLAAMIDKALVFLITSYVQHGVAAQAYKMSVRCLCGTLCRGSAQNISVANRPWGFR